MSATAAAPATWPGDAKNLSDPYMNLPINKQPAT